LELYNKLVLDLTTLWNSVLPKVREGVTGVGVWAALNSCKPVALEDDVLVIGLPQGERELAGHLKVMATKRLMETLTSAAIGRPVVVRVIDGTTDADWQAQKRRDEQAKKLQDQAMNKLRAEMSAKVSWDSVYEQLSRRYAAVTNKSLPQNRARFFVEAIDIVASARKSQDQWDEMGERNFARCMERISQYSEIPTSIVAMYVLQKADEL